MPVTPANMMPEGKIDSRIISTNGLKSVLYYDLSLLFKSATAPIVVRCDICGEDKYESGLCPNCNKTICEDCELRILHEGVIDVVCPNCNYPFGTSMIIDRSKENSNSK